MNDSYRTGQDTVLNVLAASGVLANDQDYEGDALTAELSAGPTQGSLSLASDGSFVYTPAPGYRGPDSFTYLARDAYGAYSNFGLRLARNNTSTSAPFTFDSDEGGNPPELILTGSGD